MSTVPHQPEGADSGLLYGVPAIASFLRLRKKQAYHRIAAGLIPTFLVGSTVCAREETLRKWLTDSEQQRARDR